MKNLLKKSILFIMLLFSCIIFTGCAGNANSTDDQGVSTLKVTVDKNLINSSNASDRAAIDLNSLNLYFNGVLFQGQGVQGVHVKGIVRREHETVVGILPLEGALHGRV